jgi:hypothetical protein
MAKSECFLCPSFICTVRILSTTRVFVIFCQHYLTSNFGIQADSSFTAGGKIDLKNYDFTLIFCRPNLLSIRHIISKNGIYKLIRSNFGIFSIISCLIYSILWHMHTQVFSHNFTMLNQFQIMVLLK